MMNCMRVPVFKACLCRVLVPGMLVVALTACSEDDRPFEEAFEAAESGIIALEVSALPGVLTPVIVGVGDSQTFTAVAFNSAGVPVEFDTQDRSWSVSDSSVASINSDGELTGIADGTVEVLLNFGGVTATSLSVGVSSAELVSIVEIVGPAEPEACQPAEYSAIGGFEDGSERTLSEVVWSLAPGTDAELISGTGAFEGSIVVIPQDPGDVTLIAESEAQSLTQLLTTPDNLTSVDIPADLIAVDTGSTIALAAIATFDRGGIATPIDVTDSIDWSVEDGTGSASITNSGLDRGDLTGIAEGTVNVSATCGLFFATEVAQVLSTASDDDDELSFESGDSLSLALLGGGQQLAVSTGSDFDDDDDVTDEVTFDSLDDDVVTVSATGFVLPISTGTASILATLDGASAVLTITVF